MKRIISVAAVSLFAGALMLPAALRAQGKPEGKPGEHAEKGWKMEYFSEPMREKLGISEEQQARLKAARRTKRDAAAAAMTELAANTRKLQDQLEDKAPETDLSATLDKIAAVRKSMRAAEETLQASLSSILTPTQRAKMIVAMQARMHGRGRPGGARGGKGGGKWDDAPHPDDAESDDD